MAYKNIRTLRIEPFTRIILMYLVPINLPFPPAKISNFHFYVVHTYYATVDASSTK